MNVVAYMRVSTQAQAEEDKFGLDVQRQQIEDYCRENDYTILRWYVDRGESGAKERKVLNSILDSVHNPPVEALVIAKNDRLARDIKLYFWYKHEFYKKNMQVLSVAEDYGENEMFAEILESVITAFAGFERRRIKDRTAAGRTAKAAAGGYSGGKPPYGYRATGGGALEIVPEEAEAVRIIFGKRNDGSTMKGIVDYLNSNGYRPRASDSFAISSIQRVLNNEPLYRGMYRYGKDAEWVQGQHEAILKD